MQLRNRADDIEINKICFSYLKSGNNLIYTCTKRTKLKNTRILFLARQSLMFLIVAILSFLEGQSIGQAM